MKFFVPELDKIESYEDLISDFACTLYDQYSNKNAAYGNNMSKNYNRFGKVVYAIRISDKLGRLETLLSNPDIDRADESIADTIGDAITYCMMGIGDIIVDEDIPFCATMTPDRSTYLNQSFTEELLVDFCGNPSVVWALAKSNCGSAINFDVLINEVESGYSAESTVALYNIAVYLFCLLGAYTDDPASVKIEK